VISRTWRLVWAIAVAQTVSWGVLYYAFALLIVPMERELGWSRPTLTAGMTLGLLVAGAAAPLVGRWVDRHGGFLAMTLGSLAASLLLLAWSAVEAPWAYLLVWLGLGGCMACVLYEPGFAVVTATMGADFRRAITAVTLVAGFAGTIFLPLTHLLVEALGWRGALRALAAMNLALPALLHAVFLRGTSPRRRSGVEAAGDPRAALRRALRAPAFWGLLTAAATSSVVFAGLTFHIVPLLVERGFAQGTAVGAWSLVGPAQVGARIFLQLAGPRLTRGIAGTLALALPVLALLLLLAVAPGGVPPALVAIVFGCGSGSFTIVRASAIPELLGREGYASIAGVIAWPAATALALAPTLAALLWLSGGYPLVLATLLAVGSLGTLAFALGMLLQRRRPDLPAGASP
jgi:MFS family permease